MSDGRAAISRRVLLGTGAAALAPPMLGQAQTAEAPQTVEVRLGITPQVSIPDLSGTAPSTNAFFAGQSGTVNLGYTLPPPPEALETASPDLLAAWELPPRPPAGTAAHRAWLAALRPLRFARLPVLPPVGAGVPGAGPVSLASWNWSGATLRAPAGERFAAVEGSWTLPAARPPRGEHPRGAQARCSQWIGLDGLDPGSWSLPQIGSLQRFGEFPDGQSLWWQWWIRRGTLQRGFPIDGIEVAPGDRIAARITVLGPRQVRFRLRVDPVRGAPTLLVFTVTLTIYDVAPGRTELPKTFGVEGRTAAWVVERPRASAPTPHAPSLYRLPHLDTVHFTDCAAVLESGERMDLRRAGALHIVDWDDPARPGRPVARTETPLGRTGFSVRNLVEG